MDYIANTSVGKKHVFCLNINYDLNVNGIIRSLKKKPVGIEEQIREVILRRG